MILRAVMIIIGILLLLDIAVLVFKTNFNLGWILTIFMGVFFVAYGVWFHQVNTAMNHGFLLILRYVGYGLLVFLFGVIGFLAIYGNQDNVTYEEAAVIVLGAGLRGDHVSLPLAQRLNAAYDYWQKNPKAFVVVSGGQGPGETIPEGEAMGKYLRKKGIPSQNIIEETKSTSTAENFRFSKVLLEEKFQGAYEIAYVTNSFHIYRSGKIAADEGFDATHYHGAISWYILPVVYFREFAAVLAYWL